MIQRLKHRGLKHLYEGKSPKGIDAQQVQKIRRMLALLDVAAVPADMDIPGWRLHPLKGDRKGYWSVTVTGNWRITWRFEDGRATDVDYEDYH